jgi:hypothetical protein
MNSTESIDTSVNGTLPINTRHTYTCAVGLILGAAFITAAHAETCPANNLSIHAEFIEGAPTDRLVLAHKSPAGWQIRDVAWDLSPSKGKVFFDVTDQGAGVEVFQPLRIVSKGASAATLADSPAIRDGDEQLTMRFKQFTPEQTFAITMDVDDRLGGREITVNSSEMSGATLDVTFRGPADASQSLTATFDSNAKAIQCGPVQKTG